MKIGTRLPATTEDGEACVVYFDEHGPRIEFDRVHTHPKQFLEADEYPERIVAYSPNKIITFVGVRRVRRTSTFHGSHEEYRANITFVGSEALSEDASIERIAFQPSNERLAVLYNGHRTYRQVSAPETTIAELENRSEFGLGYQVEIINEGKCQAFSVNVDDVLVTGHVLISTNGSIQGTFVEEHRQIAISYGQGVAFNEALKDLNYLSDFLSMMVGEVISPLSVSIKIQQEANKFDNTLMSSSRLNFEVFAKWRPGGRELDPKDGRRCLLSPMFDKANYELALGSWMKRRSSWGQSYALSSACLANQREFSRRRFLDAAAWFESIPCFYEKERDQISSSILKSVAEEAASVLANENISISPDRIQAILGSLNASSLSQKIQDALVFVRKHIPIEVLTPDVEKLSKLLPKIRGKFAHGEDAFVSKLGSKVYDATLLFEVIAAALTLYSLDEFETRFTETQHPFLRSIAELNFMDSI